MIELKNICKCFGFKHKNKAKVLNNITYQFPENGIVVLYGKSGCGKTTLLNVIGGLLKADFGEVRLSGEKIDDRHDIIRNQQIGYIFQDYRLNPDESVFDNVADSLYLVGATCSEEIEKAVRQSLALVGMDKFEKRFPNSLSGGQQQRIAIARAIVKKPRVILADEPTGNLDRQNTIMIMDILKTISQNCLVVLVTHEDELVHCYGDIAIELSDGTLRVESVSHVLCKTPAAEMQSIPIHPTVDVHEWGIVTVYSRDKNKSLEIVLTEQNGVLYVQSPNRRIQIVNGDIGQYIDRTESDLKETVLSKCQARVPFILDDIRSVNPKRIGKLFNLKSAFQKGLGSCRESRVEMKILRISMFLLSVVIVILTAAYGNSIERILYGGSSNNANSFYVCMDGHDFADSVIALKNDPNSAIDDVRLFTEPISPEDSYYRISFPQFENTWSDSTQNAIMAFFHGVEYSDERLSDYQLICGTADLKEGDVAITSSVADQICDSSRYSFLSSYEAILGFMIEDIFGNNLTVSGIVESDENLLFVSQSYSLKQRLGSLYAINVKPDTDGMQGVAKGQVVLLKDSNMWKPAQTVSTVKILGQSFTVSKVVDIFYPYERWLEEQHIHKDTVEKDTAGDQPSFQSLDYYYKEYPQYVEYCWKHRDIVRYDAIMELIRTGSQAALYTTIMDLSGNSNYYYAKLLQRPNQDYPSQDELDAAKYYYEDPYAIVEMQLSEMENAVLETTEAYVLHPDDFVGLFNCAGESEGIGLSAPSVTYAVIHSYNPERTTQVLESIFKGKRSEIWEQPLFTPEYIYRNDIKNQLYQHKLNILVWCIAMILLCFCIYMLLKAEMSSRIRKIGMYRCLGVKKSNLLFCFMIEILRTFFSTSFFGIIIGSALVYLWNHNRYIYILTSKSFYPVWLGLALGIHLLLVSVVSGIVPLYRLLKKSPADIIVNTDT